LEVDRGRWPGIGAASVVGWRVWPMQVMPSWGFSQTLLQLFPSAHDLYNCFNFGLSIRDTILNLSPTSITVSHRALGMV
jgi:hypothetical protein